MAVPTQSNLNLVHIDPIHPQAAPNPVPQPPDAATRTRIIHHRLQHYPDQIQFNLLRGLLRQRPEPRWGDTPQDLGPDPSEVTQHISQLEAEKLRHAPKFDPTVEGKLVALRARRDLIYWRTFRVNALPPEILVNIFRYVSWSTVGHRLCITWVCRMWRYIAIADPTLWNVMLFKGPPPYPGMYGYFERSGTAPLDLRIHERQYPGEEQRKITGEEMDSLLTHLFTKLSTIRMLIVVVDTWPPALVVLDKIRQYAQSGVQINMERFEVHRVGKPFVWIGPGYEPNSHRFPINLFGGVPVRSLNHLCLNGIQIDWVSSPIANLTTLDLRRMALEVSPGLPRFREILSLCPNLYKLALDGAGPKWDSKQVYNHAPIKLRDLKMLVIGDYSLQYATFVLSQICAPNLRDLTMMNLNGEDYSPLMEYMAPKFKDVRLLTLYTVEVGNTLYARQRVARWLDSMPYLGYLRLAQIQRPFLDAFLEEAPSRDKQAPVGQPQPLCTKLIAIEYQRIDLDVILEFGRGRVDRGLPLRKIYVNEPWSASVKPEQQAKLRAICGALQVIPLGAGSQEACEIFMQK